jgi:NAD(P)-dependent dehydrogenase (short-subunit alcohol dehydrogenase family)
MSRKVVLVTGAARGLGNAISEIFHKHDFDVIATDITEEADFHITHNSSVTSLKLNVTSEKDAAKCAEFVKEKYGKLDILISNAGVFDFYPISEAGSDRLKQILSVNLLGLANLTKHFLPLLNNSKGRLIVIGSESYKVPAPFQPYAVSKQTLESLFNAISIELSLKGIKSILIRPGAINTNILDKTLHFKKSSEETLFKKEFDKFVRIVPSYINKVSSAQMVAQVVYKSAMVKKPKKVYSINHNPLVTILSLVPRRIRNYILHKSLS